MQIRFEPSGTQVRKGYLLLRFDLYPDLRRRTYRMHHVPAVPDDATDKQLNDSEWLASLPKKLNPCLSYSIVVPENVNADDVKYYLTQRVFTPDNIATLDSVLISPISSHYISPFMRSMPIFSRRKVLTHDIQDLINSVNLSFKDLFIPLVKGTPDIIEPQSIDIGPGATDRGSRFTAGGTVVTMGNPANATGGLNSIEIWMETDGTGVEMGTFSAVGNVLTTRDYHAWGNVSSGSKQTLAVGVDIDVVTGDYLGATTDTGDIEQENTGGDGVWYVLSDQIPCTGVTFTVAAGRVTSIYATGVEASTFKPRVIII